MTSLGRLLALLYLLAVHGGAWAHDSLPVLVSIQQRSADLYVARLVVPPNLVDRGDFSLEIGPPCRGQTAGLVRCPQGIGGAEAIVAYPGAAPAQPVLLRIEWLSGETRSILAGPGATRFVIPAPESVGGVFRQYGLIGIEHILSGPDHLLFLLCLLLIAGSARRIIFTVTGFTLGHAVTISLVSLNLISVPIPPVEALIALSIMLLAAELLRPGAASLIRSWPIAVSAAFGLLHGLGFAAALHETGLPQTELPIALMAFNLGIELGQLIFVLACLAVTLVLRRLIRLQLEARQIVLPVAYMSGSIAAMWFIERLTRIV